MANKTIRAGSAKSKSSAVSNRFEPAKLDSLFTVLDAVAWMDHPDTAQIAQFAGVDPRTAGKLLKNSLQIGLAELTGSGYALSLPYPYKGTQDQKEAVVREALVRLPLLTSVRQFLRLGDPQADALRKAATIAGISPFDPADLNPLLVWATSLGALKPELVAEDLVDEAEATKVERRKSVDAGKVAFISHSSKDKPFVRQLAADLSANGIGVWLDEQRIHVGDSLPEKIAQGLASSDYFLIAVSQHSVDSPWVKKELNSALVTEVQRRKVHVLPLKLDGAEMPDAINDKKYADFSTSYKAGVDEFLAALKN